ncbi:right-handed parallel beta-helix repeat-containing protein [Parasphingorhabdus sp. JC815]|uniref:right-handed parallel beta-helix repeat-containing protein n=1 Tax=Parasphingorhabdus sp. JC815 TaxID=3232140 RepID=UPI00345AA4C7
MSNPKKNCLSGAYQVKFSIPLFIAPVVAIAAITTMPEVQAQNSSVNQAAKNKNKPPFTVAGQDQAFQKLANAVAAIGAKSGTIIIAPGSYHQCAVQTQGQITYRSAIPGKAVFDGAICEGKATLVLRGRSAVVDGIVFQNLRVPDGNGAGIRLERGNLTVTNALFRNSEQGLLTADDTNGHITIERSTFQRLGRCDRGLSCAHSIYVGDYGSLKVTRSRFEKGSGGHYIKSRAPRITVTNNSFDDTHGRATNYMIDLPSGASGEISRNIFVQGQNKENYSAFIAIAAEGKKHSSSNLNIHSNSASLAKGVERRTWFVADWSGDGMRIANNRLSHGLTRYERR